MCIIFTLNVIFYYGLVLFQLPVLVILLIFYFFICFFYYIPVTNVPFLFTLLRCYVNCSCVMMY